MGNTGCCGRRSRHIKLKKGNSTEQLSDGLTLIWLDDQQKKNPELKYILKQIDRQMIKLNDSDSCERYIRERPDYCFILIVSHQFANILVPEIDDLPQLNSVFVYDFQSNDVYKAWIKECQKIVNDIFIDRDQLEHDIRDRIGYLRKNMTYNSEPVTSNNALIAFPSETRLRSNTNLSSNTNLADCDRLYYLIWLDVNAENDEITKNELQSIVNFQFVTFDDPNSCEQFVSTNLNAQFIFIVSYEFGFLIAPRIAFLQQTIAIFVYSTDSKISGYGSWTDQYLTKIQSVVTDLTRLKTLVQYELHKYGIGISESNISEYDIIMDVLKQKEMTTKNLQLEAGNFLWFKLLVEVLINMKDNDRAHNDLVEILQVNYPESNFVSDFKQNYTPDKVIQWFTRNDSCLLKELNKALRQQHLDHLFMFRYLINDMYQQLKKGRDKVIKNNETIITLYRSQVISQSELKQFLEANTGELISINSFMSTWNDRYKAINSLKSRCAAGLARILFEIEVDYEKESSPFARVTIKGEDVTLFMLGGIFRIQSITEDNTLNCHLLKLELCSDDDADYKSIFDYMARDFIQPETDLITFGSLLRRMGELDKARKYYELILSELDQNDPNRAYCLDGLGNIENDQGQYQKALERHKQALELRVKYDIFNVNDSLIALSHIYIANDYEDIGDYTRALHYIGRARALIQKKNLPENQAKKAVCHVIEGSILYKKDNGIEAQDEFHEALKIYKEQGMPDDHPNFASIYQNLGLCHLSSDPIIHNPSLAREYFDKAVRIRLKALPHYHRSTGVTYRSLGLAYERLQDYPHALEYYHKANTIHQALNKTFSELKKTDEDIERIKKLLSNPTGQPHHQYTKQPSTGCVETATRRIILLGRSTIVKHSFAKTLLVEESFDMRDHSSSSLKSSDGTSCVIGWRDFHRHMLMVIDTPAFNNRKSLSPLERMEIARSLSLAMPGPHAFLFISEFTLDSSFAEEDDIYLTEALVKIFGPDVFRYIVFLFTNLDKLQEKGIEIDVYMKKYLSQPFIDLMKKCENRYIAIHSQAPSNVKDASFAELMLTIDRILNENEGKEYRHRPSYEQQTSKFATKIEQKSIISTAIPVLERHSANSSRSDISGNYNFNKQAMRNEDRHSAYREIVSDQWSPAFNSTVIGLSLQPYKRHSGSSQQDTIYKIPALLKFPSNNISKVLILCLGVESSLIPSDSPYSVEPFDDECVCIAYLMAAKDKYVYFIVASSIGEYLIPLIYQHRCIEQIYIYSSDEKQDKSPWMNQFPKISGCWADYNVLASQLYQDIQTNASQSLLCSNEELINNCYTQSLDKSLTWPSISLDLTNVQEYSTLNRNISLVVLHCDSYTLFHTDSQRFRLHEFSDVTKCVEHLRSNDMKSVFFIISGELHSMKNYLKKITLLEEVYATYLFTPTLDIQQMDDTLRNYKAIGRLFDNLEFLLDCLTADIKFYFEQPLYIPKLSIFSSQNKANVISKTGLTTNQESFTSFQIFLKTIREAPDSICPEKEFYERCFALIDNEENSQYALEILKTKTDQIFNWFIDAPFLSVVVNTFLQEQFPENLLAIQQLLRSIDRHFSNLSPTTSTMVAYRVQLIDQADLDTVQKNMKELITFHTYIIATKDLKTARTIARQTVNHGLKILLCQIEIPIGSRVLELDKNRILFRFDAIFSIRSIDQGPDAVYYTQLKYAGSDFRPIQEQLEMQIDVKLTWLTLGNYLCIINHSDEAKRYYQYLINKLPKDHKSLSSIYNNMGLIFHELGDFQQALHYCTMAKELLKPTLSNKDEAGSSTSLTTPFQSDESVITADSRTSSDEKCDIDPSQSEPTEAVTCYQMALTLTTDPVLRSQLQQKINDILSSIQ